MQLKTLLNHVQEFKGFVYERVALIAGERARLHVFIRPDKRCKPACSGCGQTAPHYDTLPRRSFQFIPLWGLLVFFIYSMRRVKCPDCGIKVEIVPWADGKSPTTKAYAWFLAHWAKKGYLRLLHPHPLHEQPAHASHVDDLPVLLRLEIAEHIKAS